MGTAFWIRRAVTVFALMAAFLFAVSLLKGESVPDAARFSTVWALLSASVFVAGRLYQSRRGQHCALCDDIPTGLREAE